jgi:hypothetical protein
MKNILLLVMLFLMLPLVAATSYTVDTTLQSNLVTQGYAFARVQGANLNNQPVGIVSWTMNADLGLNHAVCTLQPAFISPNGPYELVIPVQCQTGTGMTTVFPTGTKVKVTVAVPDNVEANSVSVDNIWLQNQPQVPTPFPVVLGRVVDDEAAAGSPLIFFGGIGAIVLLTLVIFLASRKEE